MKILPVARFPSMSPAVLFVLAVFVLAVAAARVEAAEVEVPVTANADVRNFEEADLNPLNADTAAPGRKGIWQLVVRGPTLSETQSFKAYFQADLHGLASPTRPLTGAKFLLAGIQRDEGAAAAPVSLVLYGITDNDDAWMELDITWNNAPKNDTGAGLTDGVKPEGTVRLAEVQFNAIGERELFEFEGEELTKYLNWKAGALPDAYGTGPAQNAEATFILVASPKSGTLRFYSRQHKAKDPAETPLLVPRLVVQQPAP